MGEWFEKKTLGTLLDEAAGRWGAREALTFADQRWSFAELQTDVEYLTKLWRDLTQRARELPAPALLYQDLNLALQSARALGVALPQTAPRAATAPTRPWRRWSGSSRTASGRINWIASSLRSSQ